MRTCDFCEVAKKANHFLPKRVTKNQDSINRYVAKIYAKHPSGIKPGNEDFPGSFQGWIYKEHGIFLCWSCCVRAVDTKFYKKIICWVDKKKKHIYSIKRTKKPAKSKPKAKVRQKARPKKIKPPSRAASIRPYLNSFEVLVNNVLVSIRNLKKYWNLDIITDENRTKATKYINKELKLLNEKKEGKFKL